MSGQRTIFSTVAVAAVAFFLTVLLPGSAYTVLLSPLWMNAPLRSIIVPKIIKGELTRLLSANATTYTSNDGDAFKAATLRWQEYAPPSFVASVHPRSEQDVQQAILYANAHNIPFFATSGKHGDNFHTSTFRRGIQIDMRAMNDVQIFTGQIDEYILVGGGARAGEVVSAVIRAGRRTVTGICDCVGMGGLALGGGHGLLQGQYGLVADQIISARLVLANGSIVTTSNDEHPELFWAIRGAGHNFGVVTEFKLKIYPLKGHENWSVSTFVFPNSQLEDVYSVVNEIAKTQPAEAVHMSMMHLNPEVDPVKPSLVYMVFYDGPEATLAKHVEPLSALKPLAATSTNVPYTSLPAFVLSSADDIACQPNSATWLRFPIDFHTPYDTTALRRVSELMERTFQDSPSLNKSYMAIEGYSDQAVRAVLDSETAFPWRKDNLLISPFVFYSAEERAMDTPAREFGDAVRNIFQEGTGRPSDEVHAYVNYANGREKGGMSSWYGFDEERLSKLRRLKRQWDPLGRFSYYAPIE